MHWHAFVLLVAPTAAFSAQRLPSTATRAAPRLALRLTESSAPPADDMKLISFATLSKDYQTVRLPPRPTRGASPKQHPSDAL